MASFTHPFVLARTETGGLALPGARHAHFVYMPDDRDSPSFIEVKLTRDQFDQLGQPGRIVVTVFTDLPVEG